MSPRILIIASIIVIAIVSSVSYFIFSSNDNNISNNTNTTILELNDPSLFQRLTHKDAFFLKDEKKIWYNINFQLKPELTELYNEIGVTVDQQNTVVISPVFTASAYSAKGFTLFYDGICDAQCLTTDIVYDIRPESSGNVIKILNLLGYKFLSDVHVDKNPDILAQYDKVILLHNEYVTKNEFDAITSHPNVVYLFPNALYAEVEADYDNNTITLVRGHGYPTEEISNGFDWEFDNTPLEYDQECIDWEFYDVDNGVMLSCWPDKIIDNSKELLKMIKEF